MRNWRKWLALGLKITLPLLVLAGSVATAQWLIESKPKPSEQDIVAAAPAVTAVRLERRTVSFPIRSQGTVQPRRETTLAARVAGQVEWVAECFDESGFFQQGQLLARIDQRDHLLRVQRLEAAIKSAQAHRDESQQELKRLVSLQEYDATTESAVDQARATSLMAEAAIMEIQAQLAEARNAAADTEIKAPFDGCIREKCVEVGQFVTVGTKLAACFATDAVEVRLPVSGDEFAFLGVPLGATLPAGTGPEVQLEVDFAGRKCRWQGRIVRSEAMVDARSRMVFLVAQVNNPYAATQANGGQPLAVGMFVEGAIRCPPVTEAIVLPESCVNSRGEMFVIGESGALELVEVDLLRRQCDWIVVRSDVADGGTVCSTRLDGAVPGMFVQVVGDVAGVVAGSPGEHVVDLSDPAILAESSGGTKR